MATRLALERVLRRLFWWGAAGGLGLVLVLGILVVVGHERPQTARGPWFPGVMGPPPLVWVDDTEAWTRLRPESALGLYGLGFAVASAAFAVWIFARRRIRRTRRPGRGRTAALISLAIALCVCATAVTAFVWGEYGWRVEEPGAVLSVVLFTLALVALPVWMSRRRRAAT